MGNVVVFLFVFLFTEEMGEDGEGQPRSSSRSGANPTERDLADSKRADRKYRMTVLYIHTMEFPPNSVHIYDHECSYRQHIASWHSRDAIYTLTLFTSQANCGEM